MSGGVATQAASAAGSWISRIVLGDLRERIVGIEKNIEAVDKRFEAVEKRFDAVDVRMEKIDGKVDKLSVVLGQTVLAVTEIQTILQQTGFSVTRQVLIGSGSPLQLLEKGKEIAEACGAYDLVSKNRSVLVAAISAKDPHTKYDIQEYARNVLNEFKDGPMLASMKTYAYDNGMRLDILLDVAAIVLRDEAMKEIRLK